MTLLQRTLSSAVVQSVAMASCAAASGTVPSQTRSCSLDSTPSFGFGDAPGSIHRLRGSMPVEPGRPAAVRDAVDIIEATPHVPLTITALAAQCHVSVRTLQEGFHRH